MLDLSTLAAKETAEIPLTHPASGEPIPGVSLVMYGPGSERYVKARAKLNATIVRIGRQENPSEDEAREAGVGMLTEITSHMVGLELEGAPVNTPEQIRRVYADPAFGWLKEQADRGAGNWANFLPQASIGSPSTPANALGSEQPPTAPKPRVLSPKP